MRMDKDFLFFDLDGTLTDPKIGITKSVQHSLRAFGISVADPDELLHFIGPPLKDSYQKYYGFSDHDAERAIAVYREYFTDKGIYENAVYGGIEEMLAEQRALGKTLVVATSKPTVFAGQVLAHFGIDAHFAFVAGSELDGRRSRKDQVIRYALDQMGIAETRGVIMVGDREHDIIGAKKTGMESIGVLYGYGSREELASAGADYIVQDVRALSALLR